MKAIFITILLYLASATSYTQIIKGKVTSENDEPLPGANIYILGTYDGTITNSDGVFKFSSSHLDTQILIVSHISFATAQSTIVLKKNDSINLHIVLKEKRSKINDVVITAGTFEAGDRKRGIRLNALDILTTANSNGDIYSGLNTLPGTQMVGEEGAIFVRGGEKYETKTFVDGMLVSNPYTSKVPDLPMRGRFSPSLFNGVLFSSGGYSAEYGQALSSALILQTHAFPTKSLTSISIFPFGGGIHRTWKGDSSSFTCSLDYLNLKPYFSMVPQKANWNHAPENLESTLMFRRKTGKSGLLKSIGTFSSSRLGLLMPSYLAADSNRNLKLNSNNIYINSVFNSELSSKWSVKTGCSFNYDDELISFDNFRINTSSRVTQFRATFQNNASDKITIKYGVELNYQFYKQEYERKDSLFSANLKFENSLLAAFTEIEWKVTHKLFTRVGTRFEYIGLTKETSMSPRISLAYKTGAYSQISLAYGIFSQLPQENFLKFNTHLTNEKATHYIINYQYSNNRRLFRIEAFSKEYSKLVRYSAINDPNPQHYNNKGYGFARGFELFLRDQKTLKHGDYWISYTYLNIRKLYQDLPLLAKPNLFSKHSLNAVSKHYVPKLKTQFGLTYQYASGRPYYIPGLETYRQGITKDYHNISANASYLTSIFNCFTIVHFSVSNLFGFDQVFGYHYVKQPGEINYSAYPIKPSAKRFFVLAIFITFDKEYIQY